MDEHGGISVDLKDKTSSRSSFTHHEITRDQTFCPHLQYCQSGDQKVPMEHSWFRLSCLTAGSIIVDPGAWTNLVGGRWARALAHRAEQYHQKCKQELMRKPLEVQGVGRGTQSAKWMAKMPIAVLNKDGVAMPQIFEVPTLEGEDGADIPALLGLKSLRGKNAVMEMEPGKECLTFPGPGGYTIEWSPGTVQIPLEVAPSGHYVIPCDAYGKLPQKSGGLVEEKTVLMAGVDEYLIPPPPAPPSVPRARY